jgi:hypothetical protein
MKAGFTLRRVMVVLSFFLENLPVQFPGWSPEHDYPHEGGSQGVDQTPQHVARELMARPLTKLTKTRTLYMRPAAIEANIDGALAQDITTLSRRAQVTDRGSPDYLTSECLVHLMRDSIRRGDTATQNTLMPILLGRCEAVLRAKIARNEHLREEVLGEFALLLAQDGSTEDSTELDYFECKFNHAFRTFRITVLKRETKKTHGVVTLSEVAGKPDEDVARRIEEALRSPATQADGLLLDERLDALPPDERKAVVLHFVMGYEIESTDPNKPTVATLCNVSGRTIRSRLKLARKLLSQIIQEEI